MIAESFNRLVSRPTVHFASGIPRPYWARSGSGSGELNIWRPARTSRLTDAQARGRPYYA